jgi:hypothetical protein
MYLSLLLIAIILVVSVYLILQYANRALVIDAHEEPHLDDPLSHDIANAA